MYLQSAVTLACLLQGAWARNYYFDGSASENGDGGARSPFNTLHGVRGLSLDAGDNLLLRRGSKFSQALELASGGSSSSPITIRPYGAADQPLPVIQAEPTQLSSVLIDSVSHVVVQDLEITNRGDNTTARRGVYVYAKDSGATSNIVLQRLHIHDVQGYMPSTAGGQYPVGKYANASGGIVLEAAGSTSPTYFQNVLIQDNFIESVGRQGIYTWSNWCQRNALAQFWYTLCFEKWQPWTGLKITRNRLSNIGGDGIVITGSIDAETTHNRVTTFNNGSGGNNAGIWTANSVNSVFRYNVVSGGKTSHDGMAYDVDHSTSGTVYEYNVSHDNEGGFMLLCPYDKPTQNFTIRYNLSINDRARVFQICYGDLVDGRVYKNTIFVGGGIDQQMVLGPGGYSFDTLVEDNIIVKSGAGRVVWNLNSTSTDFHIINNIFNGAIDKYDGARNTIVDSPRLVAPGVRDPAAYKFVQGSFAYNAGIVVEGGGAPVDFFGNPTSEHNNIGFYSGEPTSKPQWVSIFDDSNLADWTTSGSVSAVADPAGDLGNSARLNAGGSISRTYEGKNVRLHAQVRLTKAPDGPHDPANVCLGDICLALTGAPPSDVGFWNSLVIEIRSEGKRTMQWNGASLEAFVSSGKEGEVKFAAGGSPIYVDDVFVVPV